MAIPALIPLKCKDGSTNMAFPITNDSIRSTIERIGWGRPADGMLHVIGIRGAVPWDEEPWYLVLKENMTDEWNDTIGVFGTSFGIWKGTVDPGAYYTQDPLNAAGCAHLQDGVWLYENGLHKGNPALVQAGPVTVWRDLDKDSEQDAGERVESGYFGINIHGGEGAHVSEWSAGCQVVWDEDAYGPNWQRFLDCINASGQATFNYYLLGASLLVPIE